LISNVMRRLKSADGSFLRSSAIVTGGFAIARILGLGFSLLLARLLTPENYGFIQYAITVGTIMTVLTMPFAQHILARRISEDVKNEANVEATFSNFTVAFFAVFLLTIVLAIPLLLLANSLYIGIFVIFAGVSLYYFYLGTARGFVASARLSIAFVASNLLQLIIILIIYSTMGTQDPLPATLIYGLSYLPPIILLSIFAPLPINFRPALVKMRDVIALMRETVPVWISQVAYLLGQNLDVLLIRAFTNDATLGVYAFTKTLCLAFEMVPGGIQTVILPRIAMSTTSNARRKLVLMGLGITAVFNVILIIVFLVAYEPLVRLFFSEAYIIPIHIVLIMALAQSLLGVQNILSNTLLGMNRAWLDTANRAITLVASPVTGLLLIPPLGLLGAALASLIGVGAYLVSFPVLIWWARRKGESTVAISTEIIDNQ
jgi:O-antigen/teichoic acid export membrane protein